MFKIMIVYTNYNGNSTSVGFSFDNKIDADRAAESAQKRTAGVIAIKLYE
jgi:hypothetical protein